MKRAGKIAACVAAFMMSAGAAVAADVPQMVTAVAPPPPPPPVATGFDWGGLYLGPHVSAIVWPDCDGDCLDWEFGWQAGYNFVFGNFLVGAEFNVGVFDDEGFSPLHGALSLRGGLIIGDNLLVYADIGLWRYFNPAFVFDCPCLIGGVGIEYALGNALSVFGEVKTIFGEGGIWLQAGVNWHPGN